MLKSTQEDIIMKHIRQENAKRNLTLQSVLRRLVEGVKESNAEEIAWGSRR